MERHDLDEQGSFAWLAHPDEFMERASTAVALGGGGWLLVDPLDAPGLDEALAAGGEVRAVATLLNRHDRDAEAIAARHGAPRVFPRIMASRGAPIACRRSRSARCGSGCAGTRPPSGCRIATCSSRRRRSAPPATTVLATSGWPSTRCCAPGRRACRWPGSTRR